MNKATLLKIILPILFALAVALGLFWSADDSPYVFRQVNEQAADDSLRGFYEKSLALSGQSEAKSSASFLAVGDIMLSRNVAAKIDAAGDPLLPFSSMTAEFKGADFAFGNLESPFSGSNRYNPTGSLVFNVPKANIEGLVENKFKAMSFANNHTLDQGTEGLSYTLAFLEENGISPVGAGKTIEDAWKPKLVDINSLKICFIGASYASINDGGKNINGYVARIEDTENLNSTVARTKLICDFTVVSMHAGTEYVREPNRAQINFARAAIDAGADMVIGHHPHWIQTIEKYNGSPPRPDCKKSSFENPIVGNEESKYQSLNLGAGCGGKYIFYSLGNFIFDQMWSQDTREGLVLKITVSKNLASPLQGPKTPTQIDSIELMPIIIDNYSTPRPASKEEAKNILGKIGIDNPLLR